MKIEVEGIGRTDEAKDVGTAKVHLVVRTTLVLRLGRRRPERAESCGR